MKLILIPLVLYAIDVSLATHQDYFEQCCELGKNVSDSGCTEWQVPVPEVPEQYQNICIAAREICCLADSRDKACKRGQKMAKEGEDCQVQPPVSKIISTLCNWLMIALIHLT